jgi:hypothetical protein
LKFASSFVAGVFLWYELALGGVVFGAVAGVADVAGVAGAAGGNDVIGRIGVAGVVAGLGDTRFGDTDNAT